MAIRPKRSIIIISVIAICVVVFTMCIDKQSDEPDQDQKTENIPGQKSLKQEKSIMLNSPGQPNARAAITTYLKVIYKRVISTLPSQLLKKYKRKF